MAVNDPTTLTVNDVVTPIVQQAVSTLTADVQQRLSALEEQVAQAASATVTQLEPGVITASAAVLHGVETDTTTQRVLVWGIAAAIAAAALITLIAAYLGNATAQHYVAAAPAAAGALVLWLSDAGVLFPKRAAPKA